MCSAAILTVESRTGIWVAKPPMADQSRLSPPVRKAADCQVETLAAQWYLSV